MSLRQLLFCTFAGMFLVWASKAGAVDEAAVEKALRGAPPAIPPAAGRQAALETLDEWIAQPNSERSPELIAYYRGAVDRVIERLRKESPKKGIRIFQLYSSSVIVQSPTCIFAIDLDQGPNEDLLKTPEEEGVPFCMTDEEVAALADLVAYSFHTHEHSDHIDYEITRALLDRGKTVIATESTKKIWEKEPWAEKIVTLKQTVGRGEQIGDLEVNVLWDHQWNNTEHSSGTPCNAYVITLPGGITVANKGDINCALQFYGWLHVLAEKKRTIDVMCGSAIYWKGVSLTPQIDALFTPIWLPGHNWEFEHRPEGEARGNASGYAQSLFVVRSAASRGDAAPLSWGESLDIPQPRAAGKRAGK